MKSGTKKQLYIAICVYLGQFLLGFCLGWSAPTLPKLQDVDTPLSTIITESQASLLGSTLYLGSITGPYITGFLSNIKGRKPCLILGGAVSIISFILLSVSKSWELMIAARILKGVGIGILFVISFVYIGEIASTRIRGVLFSGIGVASTLGVLVVYSVGPYTSFYTVSYIGLAISIIFTIAIFTIPETPMFYILRGDQKKALSILTELGREDEFGHLTISKDDALKTRIEDWKELLTVKSNRNALIITLTLNILQQMSGILAIVFFATDIFDMAGSSIDPNIATIVIGATQLLASSATPLFIDRIGRRILLLISCASCCLSLAVLGTYFFLYEQGYDVTSVQWLPLVTLIAFFLSYDFGFGIIPGVIMGEMFASNVRSSGSTVTITVSWLAGFGISSVFYSMLTALGGYGTFWLFSGSCGLAFILSAIIVPETNQKSLAEIQLMLNKLY